MITTPEEYYKYLWGIEETDEDGNVINPYNNRPVLSIILPSDERTFDVNLSTRTINVPTFLSVAKDHRAETVYFLVDRYYEYKDLAETSCVIEYINAAGEGGFYIVPFYDVTSYQGYIDTDAEGNDINETEKMLVPWCIDGGVTKTAGPVQFALRFYELDGDTREFKYNIRTQVATAEVLTGMDETALDEKVDYDIMSTLIQDFNEKIDHHEHTVYWTDL